MEVDKSKVYHNKYMKKKLITNSEDRIKQFNKVKTTGNLQQLKANKKTHRADGLK